ncbi:DUF1178 family protein [Sandaracinobacter neustonicus]|uniref:DUF1178 family protein n=1 Tax=Sandaracinobacter neustonicus TaxID=1715348 RepID=A0A501XD92_9SPHN|nr:DUF1178 family protein [Sandaracinobacter neustonicus]TPE58541.1 DUF1178 family protein [Sandaracinobacter neustonicus]
MILFDLKCGQSHIFEGWFGSSADYEAQQARGLVSCPICGSAEVDKAVMAPAVSPKGNRVVTAAERQAETARLQALRAEVEANCDYVGRDFATQARARHEATERAANGATANGAEADSTAQAPARGIYGEASLAEAVDLLSEGIPVAPLPFRPRRLADA